MTTFSRSRAHVALAALLGLLISLGAGRASAETYVLRYIAVSGWQASEGAPPLVTPEPARMKIAWAGGFEFIPTGTTVEVTIADDLAPGGSFLFNICQRNETHAADYQCGYGHDDVTTGDICYPGPTTLSGVVPGNPVGIIIFGATSPCPDSPTTGTLTVVG